MLPAVSRAVNAQTYPTRPITMIVPYPPGGSTDVIGRIMVERMRVPLGQRIIVENVGGADGSIGLGRAARARPDGYTIGLSIMDAYVLNGAFYSLPYDLLNDFMPISLLATVPIALAARATMPAKNLTELIAWLETNPNRASAGMNSLGFRVLATLFRKQTGTQFTRRSNCGCDGRPDRSRLRNAAGRVNADSSREREALCGDKRQTVGAGTRHSDFCRDGTSGTDLLSWYGIFAPKGTPKDFVSKLSAAVVETLADPAVRSRLTELGYEIFPRERQTAEALAALQKADAEKWWPIIKELGIKAE